MTIYLITELYPVDEHDTSITHAIKSFADYWNEETIIFRPLQLSLSNLGKSREYLRLFRRSPGIIGERKVVFFLLMKIPLVRKYFIRIRRRSKLPGPDIVAGHSLIGNFLARSMARRYHTAYTVGLHYYDIGVLSREQKQYEKILAGAGLIACRSYSIRRRLNEITGERFEGKVFTANSGVEEEEIEPVQLFEDKARELGKGEIRFITVARLEPLKNIDVNIRVLSGFQHEYSYTVIGDGPEGEALKTQVNAGNLSGTIRILSWKARSEVLDHLRRSDIFIMVSEPETFGLAYLEAMAKGCIVIGAYGWGIDGVIRNGENGFLVQPRDETGLKAVIEEIVSMGIRRREAIAMASRKTVMELTKQHVSNLYLEKLKAL